MDNLQNVKKIVDEYHTSTEGKCGLSIPDIQNKSGLNIDDLKSILRQLYDEKHIKVREGLNGKLIFKRS